MIISTFDTIFQACTDAITTEDFEYRSAKLWELNLKDDTTKPEVLWALPFDYVESENKLGLKSTRMIVQLFFLKNNQLHEHQATKTVIVDAMHDAFKLWRAEFESNAIAPKINSYRLTDVYDDFDANRSGLTVVIDFEFRNTIC